MNHKPLPFRILLTVLLAALLLPAGAGAKTKQPERLFASLTSTPNLTIVYISETALKGGIGIPGNSPVKFYLSGSTLTSFEMVKADFDGKEKRAIVRLGNEIVNTKDLTLLTEVQQGFDSGFTRVYYRPDPANGDTYASQIFIFKSSNSFGATLINMTGKIDLTKIFGRNPYGTDPLSLDRLLFGPDFLL